MIWKGLTDVNGTSEKKWWWHQNSGGRGFQARLNIL